MTRLLVAAYIVALVIASQLSCRAQAQDEPKGTDVLLADCLVVQNSTWFSNGPYLRSGQRPSVYVNGVIPIVVTFAGFFKVTCGVPPGTIADGKEPKEYNAGEMSGTKVRVWSALESKEQIDGLRAQIKQLQDNVKALTAMNDALTKRLNGLEQNRKENKP